LGRKMYFPWTHARTERGGIGFITQVGTSDLTISLLSPTDLIAEFFATFGMRAKPSEAGLVAARLINQLGGLQGCRVLKINGVRRLIDEYGPLQSFTRGAALHLIWNHDPLFILSRESVEI
jgi:hypothetical protein